MVAGDCDPLDCAIVGGERLGGEGLNFSHGADRYDRIALAGDVDNVVLAIEFKVLERAGMIIRGKGHGRDIVSEMRLVIGPEFLVGSVVQKLTLGKALVYDRYGDAILENEREMRALTIGLYGTTRTHDLVDQLVSSRNVTGVSLESCFRNHQIQV